MGTENSIQKIPQSLEINEWLEYSLTSTNEIDRQIALEEMITNGYDSSFNPILTNISLNDPSQNCRSQAQWLIKLSEAKKSLKSVIRKLDITPDFILLQIQKSDYPKLSLIGQMVKKSPQEQTIELWRNTLNSSKEPYQIQVGLDILSRFGTPKDTSYALKYLQSQNSQIVCSALSLLAQQDKDLFKKNIKYGLSSKNANIILHSVHLLKTIDKTEALKYLSVLILNNNPLVRQKALRELALTNFEIVEALFWQYISREDQAFLLVKAGIIIVSNPAQHFPFKIYDIMMSTAGIKKHILQMILKRTIASTQMSGVLKSKDINSYLNEIKYYIANKKAEQTIRITVANLKSPDVSVRAIAVEELSKYISNPKIKTLLENQLKIEKDDKIKNYLASFFEDNPIALPSASTLPENESEKVKTESDKNAKLDSFPDINEFLKLNAKEQRSLLKKITKIDDYPVCKNTLLEAVNYDLKKSIILEIVKIIGNYGKIEDGKKIYHLTKSEDYSIVAQTVKSVGAIDIDLILPELNKFLAHDDPRIKSAAFEIYVIADKPAAVQYIGTMLKNTKDSIRSMGLSLIPQLDYPSAEPLLWWMLDHETNVELQNQVGYMVAANPTKDGIFKIYEFTHDKNGEIQEGLAEMWNAALISAEDVLGISKEEIEKLCWDNRVSKEEEESREQEKSDYKFKTIVGEKDEIDAEIESYSKRKGTLLNRIALHLYEYIYYYAVTSCLIGLFAYFVTDNNNPNTIHRKNKKEVASEVNFVSNEASIKETQVGSDDWKEGIKSNASRILGGSNYTNLMKSATEEQNNFRKETEKAEKEYFTKLANDSSADKEDRDWAAAKLNENYNKGAKAYDSGDFTEAERYLEKAANDPELNTFGKIDAIQKLIDICDQRKDSASSRKWLAKLLKEAKNLEGFENIEAFDNIENVFGSMENVSSQLKDNPQAQQELLKGLKESFKYSDEEAKEAMENLVNFKPPF